MTGTGRVGDGLQSNYITDTPAPPQDDSWPQDDEQVRILAYNLWERRGRGHGSPEDDWHEAERQLRGAQRGEAEIPPTAGITTETKPKRSRKSRSN
jgi:hypothetical protein